MKPLLSFSHLSLRVKLMLSYLAVTMGAILFLTFAVSLAVQNYFRQDQISKLQHAASFIAYQLEQSYRFSGSLSNNGRTIMTLSNVPVLIVVVDTSGQQVFCSEPTFLTDHNCHDPRLNQALQDAMQQKKEVSGDLEVHTDDGTFSSVYIATPLQSGNRTIGAIFLSSPENQRGPTFLKSVNDTIFLAGIFISLAVVIFSFVLARRLTQPLVVLTTAAEEMKEGNYTSRVTTPRTQDELGRLAQAFNEMADTIEADVSELKRQEQVRRDLIANIAHDLVTPLTAIQGFSEALADDVISDPAARQETAQRIAREVQRLRRMVVDLRQMTSLESGQARLDLAPLDMHTLVDETLVVIAPECEQAGITLHNDISPSTPQVLADSDRITQVLLNLLDNARRHTQRGGSIHVGAESKEHMLFVHVSDNGSGIAPQDLDHIFERFYRADRSRSKSTGGSGLGLAIVKAIITAHHGKVWAESEPGKGTRITFTLPLA
ncbi:MAG: HAMP domain-containing protein [Ktedonobacteraceae bacterium]|nr:HAMP domain-containing protein [Ktedonobacteraceae bacterium]